VLAVFIDGAINSAAEISADFEMPVGHTDAERKLPHERLGLTLTAHSCRQREHSQPSAAALMS
jgi:hypothetical protein